jgi:predicted Zn-dependent peptidase
MARPFQSPTAERFTLGNGTQVLLVERHTLPMVFWELQFPSGSISDPPGKEGRSALCMWLVVQGGPPDAVDRLADMASTLYASWSADLDALQGFSLRANLDATVDLWAETLRMPGMSSAQLAYVRRQSQARLLQAQANPSSIAWRILDRTSRGPAHPYALRPSQATYDAITLEDCRQFRDTYLQPGGARLYIAGDITRAEVADKFGERLMSAGAGPPLPQLPSSQSDRTRITFVDVPGGSQTQILMWGPGPTRQAPDYPAATVMASIFAGGVSSRLGRDLREMMGSTYSVNGGFLYTRADGMLVVQVPVQTDRTAAAISAMLADAAAMRSADVTPDELSLARDGRISALPVSFATVLGTLGQFQTLDYFGLPATYLEDQAATFGAVDQPAVRKAATDYLPADALRFVVVGDGATLLPALRELAYGGALPGGGLAVMDINGNLLSAP